MKTRLRKRAQAYSRKALQENKYWNHDWDKTLVIRQALTQGYEDGYRAALAKVEREALTTGEDWIISSALTHMLSM